jgi:hypothetical protein
MHIRRAVIGSFVVLAWTSGAMAILAEDYVAIRILEPPDVHPPPDCLTFLVANHSCGAGPGGLSPVGPRTNKGRTIRVVGEVE